MKKGCTVWFEGIINITVYDSITQFNTCVLGKLVLGCIRYDGYGRAYRQTI